jgi:hypothetical protein
MRTGSNSGKEVIDPLFGIASTSHHGRRARSGLRHREQAPRDCATSPVLGCAPVASRWLCRRHASAYARLLQRRQRHRSDELAAPPPTNCRKPTTHCWPMCASHRRQLATESAPTVARSGAHQICAMKRRPDKNASQDASDMPAARARRVGGPQVRHRPVDSQLPGSKTNVGDWPTGRLPVSESAVSKTADIRCLLAVTLRSLMM